MTDDNSKKLCFVIGPIGNEGSDERRHAIAQRNASSFWAQAEHMAAPTKPAT